MEREEDRYGELLMRPAWWAMRVVVADKANYRCEECFMNPRYCSDLCHRAYLERKREEEKKKPHYTREEWERIKQQQKMEE